MGSTDGGIRRRRERMACARGHPSPRRPGGRQAHGGNRCHAGADSAVLSRLSSRASAPCFGRSSARAPSKPEVGLNVRVLYPSEMVICLCRDSHLPCLCMKPERDGTHLHATVDALLVVPCAVPASSRPCPVWLYLTCTATWRAVRDTRSAGRSRGAPAGRGNPRPSSFHVCRWLAGSGCPPECLRTRTLSWSSLGRGRARARAPTAP
jgi:hypothetical protein